MVSFPFEVQVNHTISQLAEPPFKPGQTVTVTGAMPNGQFVHIQGLRNPLHVDRFGFNREQRAAIQAAAINTTRCVRAT